MTETPLRFHWRLPQGGERPNASRSQQASLGSTGLPDLDAQTAFCRAAEDAGIESLLTDFGYAKPDSILLSLALGLRTEKIKFIIAYRSGLMAPTTFVQQLNTLSTLIDGRFSINVVAGNTPEEQGRYGDFLPHDERYARTEELLAVCNAFWERKGDVDFRGRYYRLEGGRLNTPFVSSDGARSPELYIAGNSEQARQLAIAQGSCWMMMGDSPANIASKVDPVLQAGRSIGVRMSVFAAPTREEALAAARAVAGAGTESFDSKGAEGKHIAQTDSIALRATYSLAEREWLTPYIWTGLVRTHGAPALSLVGSAEDVAAGLMEFKSAGVTQFILSGWPKREQMEFFGREVIPLVRRMETPQLRVAN